MDVKKSSKKRASFRMPSLLTINQFKRMNQVSKSKLKNFFSAADSLLKMLKFSLFQKKVIKRLTNYLLDYNHL